MALCQKSQRIPSQMALTLSGDTKSQWFIAKQYFDDWLVSIKQQDHSSSRTEKKIKSQQTHEGFFNY